MKRKEVIPKLLIFLALFGSCKGMVSYAPLGNNYYYVFESELNKTIEKGDNIVNEIIVAKVVVDYENDNQFILIDQKPLDSIDICNQCCPDCNITDANYQDCLDAFHKSKLHHFWVIDKTTDSIYGPLSKNNYLKKRIDMNIPNDLKLVFEK